MILEKRYNHTDCDKLTRQLWEQQNVYQQNEELPLYSIDTPPPTVSGALHIGHIFSYTHTDIIARYKRMTGHSVFYPFGFDCNGLPTERFVEKKHKTNVGKVGREAFTKMCLETTQEAQKEFIELWRTMGLSADLEHSYSSISPEVQKIAQESFIKLAKEENAYMKKAPSMYCTTMRTSVAQAELEDVEKETFFNDVAFKSTTGDELVIATTRPELLPSCVALIFNPNDDRYKHLADQKAIVPIYGFEVPILQDEVVQIDKGTGLVMVCTFGDKTDIEWFHKFKLPYKQSVGFDGRWTEETGPLAGLKVADARKKILELLEESGALKNQKKITHSVSVFERSKKEIEYIVLPQWFVKIIEHKEEFIKIADTIDWHPKYMKSRYVNWVENLNWDWCISRQRTYGIPIPVWYEKDTGKPVFASVDQLPVNPETDLPAGYDGNPDDLIPEKDVMDTWNTSSLSPYICKQLYNKNKKSPFDSDDNFIPMGMRPQAHDIIRTWAFYTIVKSWMHDKKVPWKEIVISGHVLSEKNEKISKSKGNVPTEPDKLLQLYAPDAIRFWTASGSLGQDVAFSPDQIKIGQKLLTKLWNALKFIQMNSEEYTHDQNAQPELNCVNQWIIDQYNSCLENYTNYFKKHEFSLALQSVETFFWKDFCDNYIEIIKGQFFNPDGYSKEEKAATLWTLYSIGFKILQLYAPILPHITDFLYQAIYKEQFGFSSIHISQLPQVKSVSGSSNMSAILQLISEVRKLKSDNQLSLKTEIEMLTINAEDAAAQAAIETVKNYILNTTKAKAITFTQDSVETSITQSDEQWNASVKI